MFIDGLLECSAAPTRGFLRSWNAFLLARCQLSCRSILLIHWHVHNSLRVRDITRSCSPRLSCPLPPLAAAATSYHQMTTDMGQTLQQASALLSQLSAALQQAGDGTQLHLLFLQRTNHYHVSQAISITAFCLHHPTPQTTAIPPTSTDSDPAPAPSLKRKPHWDERVLTRMFSLLT